MNLFSRLFVGNILLISAGLSVLFVVPIMSGCGDFTERTTELSLDPDKTPYLINLTGTCPIRDIETSQNQAMVMCDIDGDGIKERVEGNFQKILAVDSEDARSKPCWELHLQRNFVFNEKSTILGACDDLNGDGIEEIYFTIKSKDNSEWRFCSLDPAIPDIVLDVPLPLGEDRRPPEFWDGEYRAEGILLDADGNGNPGIVLVSRVGYDATRRGIYVVSPQNGEIIWEYECGAQIYGETIVITDMDADGKREIVFSTSSPNNLGGTKINGTGDNEIYLIALSNLGETLMQVVMSGERFQGRVTAYDFNDDGVKEMVTATSNGNNGRTNELAVWDWSTGAVLKRARLSASFLGLVVVEGADPGTSYIFTGSDDGFISRYVYSAEALKCDRKVFQDSKIAWLPGALDILPPEGSELVVGFGDGKQTVILDQDLNALAIYPDETNLRKFAPMGWELSDGKKALLLCNPRKYWVFEFKERPLDVAGLMVKWGLPLAGIILLAGAFFFGKAMGHRRNQEAGSASREMAATTDFDALFRLQQELEDAHHSVVGPAKGLERLIWLLEAFITELGGTQELELRIRQIMDDFQMEIGPRLYRILHLAEQASFESNAVADTSKALDSLTQRIDGLGGQPLKSDEIREIRGELRVDWETVSVGFFSIRSAINLYFTTDPVRLIQGMLLVREGDFQREHIKTKLLGAGDLPPSGDQYGGMSCRIDNGDLRFVMDNLLQNAIRAMRECSNRHLTVQITRTGTEITIQVSDTGQGIDPTQSEAIFSSRFSSRSGGGRGLHRSREILARWGAEILLFETTPGKGTTFMVKLLAANEKRGQKTMESLG